jgi:hypothetical protein
MSTPREMQAGETQGSVLSPTLHNMYIVTSYATKYAVRIGNPFIVILNHT